MSCVCGRFNTNMRRLNNVAASGVRHGSVFGSPLFRVLHWFFSEADVFCLCQDL